MESCDLDVESVFQRADAAYSSLLEKGLIKDPVRKKIAAFVICVAGLVPTGFTSTTDKGGSVVREIDAITYRYESRVDKEKQTTHVEIKLVKMIRIIYPKMIEAFEEILNESDGNEAAKK